jgi:hypothetical protein
VYRQTVLAPARSRALPAALLVGIALAVWFCAAAIATPFDHDESQYIAGASFSTYLLIFRDFLQLQPPLHSWAFAPLAALFPNHMVLAMRLATAVIALCTLLTLWRALRVAGISRDSAAIATLLIGATAAFQFTGSVVRNDMLPTLLSSMGLFAALMALRHCAPRYWLTAGSLFGLAIATKLNFAPLGLMTGLFVISAGGRCGFRAACWLAAGALIGMTPLLLAWMLAPDAFLYGILTYGATAPFAWYTANGAGDELTLVGKISDLLKYLALGPALAALTVLGINWITTRQRARSAGRRLAIWMIGGALVGAALPTPTQIQYLMPLLPPLALALGYLLDDARRWSLARRQTLLGVLCVMTVPGLVETAIGIGAMVRNGSPVLEADAAARWAGATVRRLSGDDDIATLSPHLISSSGLELDPRFATGPFAYRSGWTMGTQLARRLHVMIPATLKDMDRDPPAAILTGYEDGTRNLPKRPDDGLIAYARSRGYRVLAMPDGVGRLYVRPLRVRHR